MCICIYIYIIIYIYMCVCVCIFIYIYMHTERDIYIYLSHSHMSRLVFTAVLAARGQEEADWKHVKPRSCKPRPKLGPPNKL